MFITITKRGVSSNNKLRQVLFWASIPVRMSFVLAISSLLVDRRRSILNTVIRSILDCKVLLCDFHREQAWKRWVSKTANGVVAHKEEILARLRGIAHASTTEEYESAVAALKNCSIWKINSALRQWCQETWLEEREVSFCSYY